MVLPRVPLANATLTAWSYLLNPAVLDDFYDRHRGRGYEDLLTFPAVVALTRDALVLHKGSAAGHRPHRRAGRHADLPGGLLCQAAPHPARAQRGLPRRGRRAARPAAAAASPRCRALPASLDGLEVVDLDGKQIKGVDKRFKPARGRPGKVIGGKVLVAYLPRTGLAVAMAADRDGEANDIRLMPRAVPLARAGPRAAAVGGRPPVLRPRSAGAAVRGGRPLPAPPLAEAGLRRRPRPAGAGVGGCRGLRVVEQWGWIGAARGRGGGTCGRST